MKEKEMILQAFTVLATIVLFANGQHGQKLPPFATSKYLGDVKDKIKIQPAPMPNLNLMGTLGPWFYQFHIDPCSWAVAEEFTNYMQVRELQGNNILLHETMRSHDLCNTVTSIVIVRGPGVFMGKDLVGNNWSGKIILVATDYTSFAINWGCTKWSVFNDGLCEDPSVYVKTRELNPHPKVLRRIETVLQNTWGISVNQLRRISNEKPCSTGGSSWIKKNGNVG